MLKSPFKKIATVFVVVSLFSQVSNAENQNHSNNGSETSSENQSTPARQENRFSKYDALRERLEALSKKASTTVTEPVLVEGQNNVVRIQPTQQQFSDGAETIKRVKWYRERMAESCEQSDRSAKLLGEFIDGCLTEAIFEKVKATGSSEGRPTFDLDAKKMRTCRDDINRYFEAKKQKVGDSEWRKHGFDQEMMDRLTKFFNWYGASVEGVEMGEVVESPMVTALKNITANNLCLAEREKTVKLPEVDLIRQAVPGQRPGQPSQEFTPPQVQTPTPQVSQPQVQSPAYQPPQGGYQGGNYDPSGIGYQGKYDPRDRGRYDYDNFRDYGDKNYDFPSYLPFMNYSKGSNYIPPSGNHSFPYRPAPQPAQNFSNPVPIAPASYGRGFNFGFGFNNAYGGMYPPLYGGGYGGYGGYMGGSSFSGGISGGYVSTVSITPTVEPISPCGGLIGGCGGAGGCGFGLINSAPCNQFCGGIINPLKPCGNNPFINPIGQIPGRIVMPRGPGSNYPWNPFYNYGPMNPFRYTDPRIPGSPLQPITPITPIGPITPITPPITPPIIPPITNPITNPVNQPPIRITLPRTQ
jgi:hypothetical protein